MIGILRKQILREMIFKVAKLEFKSCLISESNILIFKDIFRKREDQIVTLFFFFSPIGWEAALPAAQSAHLGTWGELKPAAGKGGVRRNSMELVLTSAAAAPISTLPHDLKPLRRFWAVWRQLVTILGVRSRMPASGSWVLWSLRSPQRCGLKSRRQPLLLMAGGLLKWESSLHTGRESTAPSTVTRTAGRDIL